MDSSRPILNADADKRASVRISTYSMALSEAPTEMTFNSFDTTDSRVAEIREYTSCYERLENKCMQEQRYAVSPQKEGDMSKLALEAKVQRALDRRYTSQDAVLKPKILSEKSIAA